MLKYMSHDREPKRTRKNYVIRFAVTVLAIMIPIAFLAGIAFIAPPQYSNTFLGELSDKYERLYSIEDPKIVVIGGSSTAFGLNSELLSEYMGMPVVNFGLYATLGTKVMLDLSEDAIGEGDIVVIAPETDEQTLSLYFNAETMWQALDSNASMLKHISSDNAGDLVGAFFGYASKKLGYLLSTAPNPEGVYNHASFNEYGDIVYERPSNIMTLGYDPNMTVNFSPEMFDEDFIDYLNIFIDKARKNGAEVYYSFPPINKSCVSDGVTEDTLFDYYDFICRNINCDVISNINDYIMDENYFYDSNFHLNDSGVTVRTATLISDLYKAMGNLQYVDIELPEPPPRGSAELDLEGGDNSYAEYFIYEEFGAGLKITGVTDDGKLLKNITVPTKHEDKPVLAIGEGAFSGCDLLKTVTVNSNIIQYYNRIFDGCSSLERINMNYTSAEGVSVGDDLFGGASDSAKLYIMTQSGYESFISDYFWGPYGANGDRIKKG